MSGEGGARLLINFLCAVIGVICLGVIVGSALMITQPRFSIRHVDVGPGRTVECITYHAGIRSGLSCDWEHPIGRSVPRGGR